MNNPVDSLEDINNQRSLVDGVEKQSLLPSIAWVLCDDCQKWRCISTKLADHIEETKCKWTCKDNLDKEYSDCSIPQAKTNEEINAELEISDASADETTRAISLYYGGMDERQVAVCKQSTWTHIKYNTFLHRGRKRQSIDEIMICHCKPPIDGRLGCGDACLNRVLNIECVQGTCPCGGSCSNQQFQKRKYAKLKSVRCGKKGFGLHLLEDIPRGQFVIEYVGEVLDLKQYHTRQKEYASLGHRHFYFMTLNGNEVIDACSKGNLGRFINHSCNPNCCTEKWMVNGEVCVGLFALRDIKKGEELTFDYNYVRVFGAALKKCFCGSSQCRGFIGGDPINADFIVQGDSDEEIPEPVMIYKGSAECEAETPEPVVIYEGSMECKAVKGHETAIDQAVAKTVSTIISATVTTTSDISANKHLEEFSSVDKSMKRLKMNHEVCILENEDSKKTPLLDILRVNDPPFSEKLPENMSHDNGVVEESQLEGVKYHKGSSKSKYLEKMHGSSSSSSLVKKGELCHKQHLGTGRTLLPCNKRNRTRDFTVGVCPGGVEVELNQLLDANGGITKGEDSTKGYLKLLVQTVGSHVTIESTRDVSMILDGLLKTRSSAILNDIVKKNGLQMLHNIIKQYRKDFKMTPVLRKLLKILEYLAEKQILTSDLIHAGPPCSDMESFRDSIFQLTDHHPHTEVRKEARNFRQRWIVRSGLKQGSADRGGGCSDQGEARRNPISGRTPATLPEKDSALSARDYNVPRRRESRWDRPRKPSQGEATAGGQSSGDDSPPGFSRPRLPPTPAIAVDHSEVETGAPLKNLNPFLPVTFGIPLEAVRMFGESLPEASGCRGVALGILFPPAVMFASDSRPPSGSGRPVGMSGGTPRSPPARKRHSRSPDRRRRSDLKRPKPDGGLGYGRDRWRSRPRSPPNSRLGSRHHRSRHFGREM